MEEVFSVCFSSVDREDGGMYQCVAGNEEEESQGAGHLVLGGGSLEYWSLVKSLFCDASWS